MLLIFIFGCAPLCSNDPIHVDISPDKKNVAIAYIRNCGATTGFSTHVSILTAPGKLSDEGGNAFIIKGKHPLTLKWKRNKELTIEGSLGQQELKRLSSYRGIEIEYK